VVAVAGDSGLSAGGAATEQVGQAAVEVSGKASWTPSKGEGAEQGRRPASRRSGEGETKRGSKRGRVRDPPPASRSSTSKDGN